ncbi:MAG: hypothetical protein JSW69_04895 [Deltaproteobacteria bacterium]|jgi:hypothetical protein|nr:MAG: hypothetical protein JSW69_04895 [Deltaproteobacteria bacterium]
MANSENTKTTLEQAGENLFNFAVDREDVKTLIEHLPSEAKCTPAAIEYELQLLKIISTGWSISFFMDNSSLKDKLADNFWKQIHEFSASLSETTGLMTGQNIDYFQILKSRLDMYVAALTEKPEATEPASVVGPAFAKFCGDPDDIFSVMTGSRMFLLTVARVKEYLESVEL